MTVGKLRHRITFQRENSTDDGSGGFTDPWANPTTVTTVWAEVKPMSARERLHSAQLDNPITHEIRIRFRSGLSETDRIVFENRILNIRSIIDPDERSRWLMISAVENVAT